MSQKDPQYVADHNGADSYKGAIDQLAIFDRALTPAEVAELYTFDQRWRGATRACSPRGEKAVCPSLRHPPRHFTDPGSHAYVPGAAHVLARVRRLVRAFSGRDLPISLTRHANTPENAGMLARWWDDLIMEGSPLAALSPDIDASVGTVLGKTQYDAFHGTGLEEILREHGFAAPGFADDVLEAMDQSRTSP